MRHKCLGARPLSSKHRRRNWRGLIPGLRGHPIQIDGAMGLDQGFDGALHRIGRVRGHQGSSQRSPTQFVFRACLPNRARVGPRDPPTQQFFPSIPPAEHRGTVSPYPAESARRSFSIRLGWAKRCSIVMAPTARSPNLARIDDIETAIGPHGMFQRSSAFEEPAAFHRTLERRAGTGLKIHACDTQAESAASARRARSSPPPANAPPLRHRSECTPARPLARRAEPWVFASR